MEGHFELKQDEVEYLKWLEIKRRPQQRKGKN